VTVHPHTRGEFCRLIFLCHFFTGSPPHAWGILKISAQCRPPLRFTPTRVGNSTNGSVKGAVIAVHPHTRGEFSFFGCGFWRVYGSPPHAWGIHGGVLAGGSGQRFTPTRVGNSDDLKNEICKQTVHPHTRGEFVVRSILADS